MFPLRRRQVKYEQGQELRNAIPVLSVCKIKNTRLRAYAAREW